VKESFRFFGIAKIEPTPQARRWAEEMVTGIEKVLRQVAQIGDFVEAMYKGALGTREEGAYPGRTGKDTVFEVK
jgi:hypothetical protein